MPTLGGRKPTSAGDCRAGWRGAAQPHRAGPARSRPGAQRLLSGVWAASPLIYRTFLLGSVRNRWDGDGGTEVPDLPIPAPCSSAGTSLRNFH